MKVQVIGDIVNVTANINFEELKKLGKVTVTDSNDKPLYAVSVSELGSMSKVGTTFTFATTEGKAALNVCIQPGMTNEEKMEFVSSGDLGMALEALAYYENEIAQALVEAATRKNALQANITIA